MSFTRTALALAALGLAAAPAVHAQATLASSTFNTNDEGWTVVDLHDSTGLTTPLTQTGGPFTPVLNATGGNPGGYISYTDADADSYNFYAPAKFLGNKAAAFGGSLSFDIRDTDGGGGVNADQEDLILVGTNGVTVSHTLVVPSTTAFTHESVALTTSGWTNLGTGQAASAGDMQAALGSLQSLYILGDFETNTDTASLDNVVLATAPAPEPSQTAAFGLGVVGLSALTLRARRRAATRA